MSLGPWSETFYRMKADEAELLLLDSLMLRAGLPCGDSHPDAEDLADNPRAIVDYSAALLGRHRVSFDDEKPNQIIGRAYEYGLQGTIATAVRLAVLSAYEQAPGTHHVWAGRTQVADFKPSQIGYAASMAELKPVAGGAVEYAQLSGASEIATVKEYGRILQCGRHALAANDISSVLAGAAAYGVAADTLESNQVYTALAGNATLSDGVAVFHSTHANVGATHIPDATGISAAIVLLRAQTDEQGQYLPMTAAAIVVPPAQETTALAAVTSLWGVGPDRPAVRGEPRLTAANNWFLFCAPRERPVVQVVTLRGTSGPTVSTGSLPGYDGLAVKIRYDVTAASTDYRGAVRTLTA